MRAFHLVVMIYLIVLLYGVVEYIPILGMAHRLPLM